MVQMGIGPARGLEDNEYRAGDHAMKVSVTLDLSAADAGANDGVLRKGLVLGKVTATGKYKQYNNAAVDGTQTAAGILDDFVSLIDEAGEEVEAQATMLVHGMVVESKLYGCDAAAKADLADMIYFA